MRKKQRKPHPKFPGRDTLGRMMKGCRSPNPFSHGLKPTKLEEREKSPEPELVTSEDIDRELVRVVSRRKYVAALKRAVENGDPAAVQRYEKALASQPATATAAEQLGPVDMTGFSYLELLAVENLMDKLDLSKDDRPSVDALLPVKEALRDEIRLELEPVIRHELEAVFEQKVQKAVEEKMERLSAEDTVIDATPRDETETDTEPHPAPIEPQTETETDIKPKRDSLGVHSLRRRNREFETNWEPEPYYWRLIH